MLMLGFFIFEFFYMKEIEEILFSNIVPCLDLYQVTRFEFFEQKINKILTKLVKYVQFLVTPWCYNFYKVCLKNATI